MTSPTLTQSLPPQRGRGLLSETGAAHVLFACLATLALNAVLIQTVIPDDSIVKYVIRGAALATCGLAIIAGRGRVPVAILLMGVSSMTLLALTLNPDQLTYVFVFVLFVGLLMLRERDVERAMLVGSVASLLLVFAFLVMGVTQNVVLDHRGRATYGTNGVPFFYNLVYGAFTLIVYYAKKYRLPYRSVLTAASLAATTYFFLQTDARGGYLSFLTFVILTHAVPRLSRSGIFRAAVGLVPALSLVGVFVIAGLAGDDRANQLLSYRPMLLDAFLNEIDPGDLVLSRSVKQVEYAVDNSYIHLLVGGGLLLCVAFLVLFRQATQALFRQGGHIEISFLIASCLYFNSESLLLRIENLFVVLFWYLVLKWARGTWLLDPAVASSLRYGHPAREVAFAGSLKSHHRDSPSLGQ